MEIHTDSKFCSFDSLELPKPNCLYSLKAHYRTFELILEILDHYENRPTIIPGECFNKIYMAGCILKPEEFEWQLGHYKRWAFEYRKDPISCLHSISEDIYTQEINEQYWKIKSIPDMEKFKRHLGIENSGPSSQKAISSLIPKPINFNSKSSPQRVIPWSIPIPKEKHLPKRGQLWKLDCRWDHLCPSSRKIFKELLRRSQPTKKPFAFPWCQAGVRSLVKFTGISEHQVRNSIHQLQNYSFIKRIVRGYENKGASKYYVFLTPKMSGAFYWKALHAKKHPLSKKRIARIS